MNILKTVAVGVVSSFLISASYLPVFAGSLNDQESTDMTSEVTTPCGPLSSDTASKLPWSIKATQVVCMSPTPEDFEAMPQARSLMARGAAANSRYQDGAAAYAAGRYVEAIAHFQAAVPSAKP
jgi:hypothetical protein